MSTSLDIRILGPLEVERGGALARVGGPKAQVLLGLLALRAGAIVSAEEMESALWGEEPPRDPRATIQVYLSRFRRSLLVGQAASIERVEAGYVLQIDPEQIDAHRFQRLVEDGNAAFGRGDLDPAIERLDRALKLWRGAPLAGLDLQGSVTADIVALEERRTAALATLFEVRLAAGEADELIPELELLLAEHPMNERLHGLTMLALVRAGRQSKALELGASLRRLLSQELGIDPSANLQDLERRILDADPDLHLAIAEIEDIGAGGAAPTREGRKTVAALVVRIDAADPSGELPDPEVSRSEIERLDEEARGAVERHGGDVHESLAGTIVALFGVPRVHEDDAARAARAAVEIHELAGAMKGDDSRGWWLEVRAAIAAGEVLVEDTGQAQRLLSAGPVEEARWLTQTAKPGETLLTPTVQRLARHELGAAPSKLVLVGDDAPAAAAFRLIGLPPVGTAQRLTTTLVGRAEELEMFLETFTRVVRERACSMVTVLGAAGVGKSRLVSEFLAGLGADTSVLSGRCLPYGRDMTYRPVAEIVCQLAGITATDGARTIRERVDELLEGEPDAEFLARRVVGILGVEDVTAESDEIFWAVRKILEVQARKRPVVVVFDDIHWADTTLLDLIEHIVRWARDAPILLVATSRPELATQREGWGGGNLRASNLMLSTLTRDETETLIDGLLGAAELAPRTKQRIVDVAEGHPLHVEELLSMLIDDGLLAQDQGRWVPTRDLSDVPIPLTVQTLLSSRLDRLAADERRVMEIAAVIGTEFTERDLLEMSEGIDEGLTAILEGLARKDLLVPERLSSAEGHTYRFRHILIRDVTYHATSKDARARTHERFGEAIERRVGERLGDLEEIVGYHFEAAWRLRRELGTDAELSWAIAGRAGERLRSAGRRAFARGDLSATVGLLSRALDLGEDGDDSRPEIALMLGVALLESGDMNRAEAIIDDGLAAAERLGDERLRWRLWIERADLHLWRGPESTDPEALGRRCAEAISAFERLGDRSGVARVCRMIGDAESARGRFGEASEWYVRGREAAIAAGDAKEAGERPTLGTLHGPTPLEDAIELVTSSLDELERPNPEMLAVLGTLEGLRGRVRDGLRLLDRSLADAEEMGSAWRVPSIRMMYGMLLLAAEAFSEAEEMLRLAVEAFQGMGERYQHPTALALYAHALYGLGRLDDALAATEMSEEIASPLDVASMVMLRTARAKVLAARGDAAGAETLARVAVEQADESDMLIIRADAHRDMGAVLEAAGKRDDAIAESHEAHALYEQKDHVLGADRARAELDHLTVPKADLEA